MRMIAFRVRNLNGDTVFATVAHPDTATDAIAATKTAIMHLKAEGYRVFRVKTKTRDVAPDSPVATDPRD